MRRHHIAWYVSNRHGLGTSLVRMAGPIDAQVVCGYVVKMEFGVHERPQGNPLEPAMHTLGPAVTGASGNITPPTAGDTQTAAQSGAFETRALSEN